MSAPAAPNTSPVTGPTALAPLIIDMKRDPTTFKRPLIIGEDAQAEAIAPWGLNIERNGLYGTRSSLHFAVVANLVDAAAGGQYVLLRWEDAIHVYLLGWDLSREAFGATLGREKGALPQGDCLSKLLAFPPEQEELSFLEKVLTDEKSIAWMQGVLRAVAARKP